MLGGLLAITATANAMPTQEETKKVEPLVMDLMKDDQVALKSGKKTRVEVAESAMSLADKADSEAAKLLLIKGAFNLYVRAGEFDKAIETLQALQAAIPDIPPANMASIIESSLRVVPRKNGGQLYRLLDETKLRMRYTSAAKKMEKTLKENPTDRQLRTKLAEHYAYLGKWDQALENFAAADGKVGVIAKSERDGDATGKVADFWWAYPNGKAEELVRAFRTHAAKLYEDAIAAGKVTGLNKVQAERRIAETKEYGEQDLFAAPDAKDGLYCVIDLSGGSSAKRYPVSYLRETPKGGWTDEYKTRKLVLRKVKVGKDPLGRYTLSKDFYIGVFEVTQKQIELLTGLVPGELLGNDKFPVAGISYNQIRGIQLGSQWPHSNEVDKDSILGLLRARTGLCFDLPTEMEWEYACRAGTTSELYNGRNVNANGDEDKNLNQLCCYRRNCGQVTNVGRFLPNANGLYDMYGNVNEWCRDWFGDCFWGDPVLSGKIRAFRGAAFVDSASLCTSNMRQGRAPDVSRRAFGFRLVIEENAKK